VVLLIAIGLCPSHFQVVGQDSSFKGKINPEVVLSPNAKSQLLQKFSLKKGKSYTKEDEKSKIAALESPPSGRYRVSIIGYICEHETRDDIFAYDGLGDEIRLNVDTTVVDSDGQVLLHGSAQSRVMGSVNSDDWRMTRVQAGTADRFGGIVTGNHIPSRPAYAPIFSRIPANTELPFLLFEGDLVRGMNSVIIIPTAWEIDGGAGLWPRFQRAIADAAPAIITAAASLAGGPAVGAAIGPAAQATIGALDHLMTGIRGNDGGDRVVGIHRNGDQESFTPQIIRLNYDIAELALRTRVGGPAPAGVLPIVYNDDGDLNGNYTLYIKIERLDPIQPPG